MPRLAYLAIGFLPSVFAQIISNAVCSVSSFDWAFNSVGDSPCTIAAELAGVCNGGVFTLEPLDQGFVYLGPSRIVQNSCRCSSVYYSMLSACAGCQGRNWLDWNEYNPNCTIVYPRVFPQPLPSGTRVPAWAYTDIDVTNGFNTTVAQALLNRPESTAVPGATATTGGTSRTLGTATARTTSRSTSLATSPPLADSSKSNTGAIAGGVIGGVVGIALIGGLAFFFVRRRHQASAKPPSSAFNTTPYTPAPYNSDPSMGYNPTSPYLASQPQKLYDPTDPSTFPSTPAPVPSSPYTTTGSPPPPTFSSNTFGSSTQIGQNAPQMPSPMPAGRYTGAPEV